MLVQWCNMGCCLLLHLRRRKPRYTIPYDWITRHKLSLRILHWKQLFPNNFTFNLIRVKNTYEWKTSTKVNILQTWICAVRELTFLNFNLQFSSSVWWLSGWCNGDRVRRNLRLYKPSFSKISVTTRIANYKWTLQCPVQTLISETRTESKVLNLNEKLVQ